MYKLFTSLSNISTGTIFNKSTLAVGQKRPLDMPKRMIKRRERERKVEGEI
jgi:hypothetical protein